MARQRNEAVALGRVIARLRGDFEYSRPDLAKVAGLSYPYLYEIEKGTKYPKAEALEKIAGALELSLQELIALQVEVEESLPPEPEGAAPPRAASNLELTPRRSGHCLRRLVGGLGQHHHPAGPPAARAGGERRGRRGAEGLEMSLEVRGFELTDWQRAAVDAWRAGDDGRPWRGTIEVVTGGGKSLIALACAAAAARTESELKIAVVVPTQALAAQWVDVLTRHTNLAKSDIGVLGAGRKDDLQGRRALVAVLNSAARSLPELVEKAGGPLMLIVDECHRAGAPKFKRVLDTRADFRLGLSATPDREELGDDGEPLAYDEQAVGLGLGGVVFSFGLKEARLAGWLPVFTLHHHAVTLLPEERARYEAVSRQVDDAADEIKALGGETARARQQAARGAQDLAVASRRWVTLTAQRKDLLYRARERERVAGRLATQLFDRVDVPPRMLLFHERVDEAERLWRYLTDALPHVHVVLEHSRLGAKRRQAGSRRLRVGTGGRSCLGEVADRRHRRPCRGHRRLGRVQRLGSATGPSARAGPATGSGRRREGIGDAPALRPRHRGRPDLRKDRLGRPHR